MEKLVTIIVTAYNQADVLPNALNSILNQKCDFDYEILIGDDCSTDNTRDICNKYMESYPDKIRTIHYETNGGIAKNFVLTLTQARGKYISNCASDDFWHNENKLQLQVDFLKNNPDTGLIYTEYDQLTVNTGKITKNWIKSSQLTPYQGFGITKLIFEGKVPIATVTVMFVKELFDKYIPYEDYIKYNFPVEDWPTWLFLSKHTKIGFIAESTSTYCVLEESVSHTKKYENVISRFTRDKVMYKYLCEKLPEDLNFDEDKYDKYVNSILLKLAFKKQDYKNAKKYGKVSGKTIKTFFSSNRLLFWSYIILKKIASCFQ